MLKARKSLTLITFKQSWKRPLTTFTAQAITKTAKNSQNVQKWIIVVKRGVMLLCRSFLVKLLFIVFLNALSRPALINLYAGLSGSVFWNYEHWGSYK